MEQKITVVSPKNDGTVSILQGSEFHTLKFDTRKIFRTTNPQAFCKYANAFSVEEWDVFYTSKSVVLVASNPDEHTTPDAVLELEPSIPMALLERHNNRKMSFKDMEQALLPLRRYMDTTAMDLLNVVRNPKFEKVTKVEETKSNDGNFAFAVTHKDASKADVVFPEKIKFKVPVFKYFDKEVEFEFEPIMDFQIIESSVKLSISFNNYEMDVIKEQVSSVVIESALADLKHDKFMGCVETETYTDGRKYVSHDGTKFGSWSPEVTREF
jgi:hypothetical protein